MKIISNVVIINLNLNKLWTSCFILVVVAIYQIISPVQVQAGSLLSVDNTKVIQNNFLGVNAVYHGFALCQRKRVKA